MNPAKKEEEQRKEYQTHMKNYNEERKKRKKDIEEKLKLFKKEKFDILVQLKAIRDIGEEEEMAKLNNELKVLSEKRDADVVEFKMIEKQHEIALALYKENYKNYTETNPPTGLNKNYQRDAIELNSNTNYRDPRKRAQIRSTESVFHDKNDQCNFTETRGKRLVV